MTAYDWQQFDFSSHFVGDCDDTPPAAAVSWLQTIYAQPNAELEALSGLRFQSGDSSILSCSVIICTYNRATLLAQVLDSLAAQRPALGVDTEIIVVDNNCVDSTAAVVDAAAQDLPLRRVTEARQGLSHARNRGVAEAVCELVLFADDVLLDAHWLQAYRNAASGFVDAGFFGGRIRPYWPDGRPSWVHDESMALLAGIFGCVDHGLDTRRYEPGEDSPVSANFAVRKQLFETLGVFDPHYGRSGQDLGRGEETAFLMKAQAAGFAGVYVGAAFCRHYVAPQRLRLAALYRYGIASAHAHRALRDPNAHGRVLGAVGYLVRGCVQLFKGRGDRFRQCVIIAGIQIGLRR